MRKRKESAYPTKLNIILILCFATAVSLTFVYSIKNSSGLRPYLFIFWDTFLAWVPVILALLLDLIWALKQRIVRGGLLTIVGAAWLFFYPNAPYLVTDLLHVFVRYHSAAAERFWVNIEFWNHFFTLFSISMLGIFLGSFSLYSVHCLVRRAYGKLAGWIFAVSTLLLSSFGIYIGRFIRWNSWDVVTRPFYILQETVVMLSEPDTVNHIFSFCKLMFPLLLIGYLISFVFLDDKKPLC